MTTLARTTDPLVSHQAAAAAGAFIGTHEDRIRQALAAHGPMAKSDIARVTGLTGVQVDRRLPHMPDLEPEGGTRQSDSGRLERIWRVKP